MKKFLKKLDIWFCKHLPVRTGDRQWWHELWIREDEFHPSLDIDPDIVVSFMRRGKKADLYIYQQNIIARRKTAHDPNLAREDAKHKLPALH